MPQAIRALLRDKKSWNNFDVKVAIIADRKLIRVELIRTSLQKQRSSILVEHSHSKLDRDFSLQSTR